MIFREYSTKLDTCSLVIILFFSWIETNLCRLLSTDFCRLEKFFLPLSKQKFNKYYFYKACKNKWTLISRVIIINTTIYQFLIDMNINDFCYLQQYDWFINWKKSLMSLEVYKTQPLLHITLFQACLYIWGCP